MKCKIRITADSLYPKRPWDKTFEISIHRLKNETEFVKGTVVFEWKNIYHYGLISSFQLNKWRFIQKLTDFYVGGI